MSQVTGCLDKAMPTGSTSVRMRVILARMMGLRPLTMRLAQAWHCGLFTLLMLILIGCGGGPTVPPSTFARLAVKYAETLSSPPTYAYDAQIAVSPITGEVFLCWVRRSGAAPEIFCRHGTPGKWSKEEAVSEIDGLRSWNPATVAGPDGCVHLAYMDQKLDGVGKEIYARSRCGDGWGPESLLSCTDAWTGWDPDIEVHPDGRPAVCWFDHGFGVQHEILMRSGDGAGGWLSQVRLTNDNHWQYFPDIAIDSSDSLHLVQVDTRYELDEWYDTDHYAEGRNLEIYYRRWLGDSPGPEVRLTDSPLRSIAPQIDVDRQGRAHVIWLDETESGYNRLYYTVVTENEPGKAVALSSPGRRADFSSIARLGDRIFVAGAEYVDPLGSSTAQTSLCVREILDGGRAGTSLAVATEGTNLHPRLVADERGKMLWVVWMEYVGDDETLITGQSYIRLAGVTVED